MRRSFFTYWIIWYAIGVHFLWAGLLFTSASPLNITAIKDVHEYLSLGVVPHFGAGHNVHMAVFYLVVGALALAGLLRRPDTKSLLLLLPQQYLIILSATAAFFAIDRQSFADGVVRPWAFIAADQGPWPIHWR